MPIGENNQTQGNAQPLQQLITWDRVGSQPSIESIYLTSTNATSVEVYIQYENTSVNWIELSGYGQTAWIAFNKTMYFPLSLINTSSLGIGNYKATVYFRFTHADADDALKPVVINLSITGASGDGVKSDKDKYTLIYRRSTNTLSGDLHVNILNNNDNSDILFEPIGTLLKSVTSKTGFDLVEDPTHPFSTHPSLPITGVVDVNCRLKKEGSVMYAFIVSIVVFNDEDIYVNLANNKFELRRGFNETRSQVMQIINPLEKNFNLSNIPAWLTVDASSGNNSRNITLTTVNSETLAAGNYQATFYVNYDSKSIPVFVELKVTEFVSIETADYNFCLDKVILKANKMQSDARFLKVIVAIDIKAADKVVSESPEYLIPYFKDQAETDIGAKVHNYFPIFEKHLFSQDDAFKNQIVYERANVNLTIQELDVNYNIILTTNINNIKLFPGHRPKYFPLFTSHNLRRKYKENKTVFSYFSDLLNANSFSDAAHNPELPNSVQTAMASTENLDLTRVKNNTQLDFLPFPKTINNHVMQWINNNLVPEWFTFSGEYKIQTDFGHVYDNVTIGGKKYATTELAKLTINTGFMLREEKALLKEVLASPISFIKLEGEVFRCFCISQKLTEKDSSERLINFDVEFLIVKTK